MFNKISTWLFLVMFTALLSACNGSPSSSSSTPIITSPTITFESASTYMSTNGTTTLVLNGNNLSSSTVVNFQTTNDLVTLSPSSCTLTAGNSTCEITLSSSQNTGHDQIIATATGFTINAVEIDVYAPGSIILETQNDNPTILGGSSESVAITLKSFELSSYPTTVTLSTSSDSLALDNTSCTLESSNSSCLINVTANQNYTAGIYQINATANVGNVEVAADPLSIKIIKPGQVYFNLNQKLPLFIGDTAQVELVIANSSDTRTITFPLRMAGNSAATYSTNNQADTSVCVFQPSAGIDTCTITINAGSFKGDSFLIATDPYTPEPIAPLEINVYDTPEASFNKSLYNFPFGNSTINLEIVYNTDYTGSFTTTKNYTISSRNDVGICYTFATQQTCTFNNTEKVCLLKINKKNDVQCSINDSEIIIEAKDQDDHIIETSVKYIYPLN